MRKFAVLGVAALLLAGCATASVGGPEEGGGGPVTLTFQSLAFQPPTIAATEQIVADWNAANPDVQVELTQGTFDTIQDQLTTQFQGGTAPDVIHSSSEGMTGFARQGYLADLGPLLSDETSAAVPEPVWESVTVDGARIAAPTLLQTYLVYANTALLEQAGVAVPTGATWPWAELRAAAAAATTPTSAGLGWGLRQPTATVVSLGMNFGAEFFTGTGDEAQIAVGDAELEVPRRIHEMAYTDLSLDPVSLTQSGTDVLTAFLDGRYAMFVGGSFVGQQLVESAPEGFSWVALPALSAGSAEQAANPQTLSVPADSPNVEEAAAFIDFYMQAGNLAAVAQGDWLIPTTDDARAEVQSATGGADGWSATLASADGLATAPFQSVTDYPQWKDQIATPALQRYLAGETDLPTLQAQLTDGWASIGG